MADVAASAVGFISLGITVVQGLVQYYSSWRDCDEDTKTTLESLHSLEGILLLIQSSIKTQHLDPQQRAQVESCITSCSESIHQLSKKLKKIQGTPLPQSVYVNTGSSSVAASGVPSVIPTGATPTALPFRDKLKHQSQRLLYPFKKSTLLKLQETVSELKGNLSLALQVLQLNQSQSTVLGVARLNKTQDDQQRKTILAWLSDADYAMQHVDHLSSRQEGTGQWLLTSPEFLVWESTAGASLFCPGIPGAGKTKMACTVIDHLQQQFRDDENVGICFVYCRYNQPKEDSVEYFLASLLEQLVWKLPALPETLVSLHSHHHQRRSRPSVSELVNVLEIVVKSLSRTFIVLDALDECTTTNSVRTKLLQNVFQSQSRTNLQIFATSRPFPDIESHFEGKPTVEIRATEHDVRRYLETELLSLPECVQANSSLRETICNQITDSIDGMFLLARLHIDTLRQKRTPKDIKKALNTLPKGIAALGLAYDQVISRIEGQDTDAVDLAKRAFSWITYAKSPLSPAALQHALATDDDFEFDEDSIPELADILSVCAGLLIVDEETNVIRFVHYTTQQYFESKRVSWLPCGPARIAKACITYLSIEAFNCMPPTGYPSLQDYEALMTSKFALLRFANQHWSQYALEVDPKIWMEMTISFLLSRTKVIHCDLMHILAQNIFYFESAEHNTTGLHLAARHGLTAVVEYLMKLMSTDSRDWANATPLYRAAEQGHVSTMALLLTRDDVDVNAQGHLGRTPLIIAARAGFVAAVKLLLQQPGLLADLADELGLTPLAHAARFKHESIVDILLARDDEVIVDRKDKRGYTPLSHAVQAGNESIVKTLLSREDVAADHADNNGCTPLSHAAKYGHDAIVNVLLSRDDVAADCADINGCTPLSHAAKFGHDSIVNILLSRDDVAADHVDNKGRTPLVHAAWAGQKSVVEVLLSHNDVAADRVDHNGRTLLAYAAYSGHVPTMETLLARHDIAAEQADYEGCTPLFYAAGGGSRSAVEFLLARDDVSADRADNNGRTLLSWAVGNRNDLAITETLLDRDDVSVDRADNAGRTPLSYAASMENAHAVELLLARNVVVDRADGAGRTPISYAASRRVLKTVQLFLRRNDVEKNSRDENGFTPLMYAACAGWIENVKLFLKHCRIMGVSGSNYGQSLDWSARQSDSDGSTERQLARSSVETFDMPLEDFGKALVCAANGFSPEILKLLLTRAAGLTPHAQALILHYVEMALEKVLHGERKRVFEKVAISDTMIGILNEYKANFAS